MESDLGRGLNGNNLAPWRFLERGWFHRHLIHQLAKREVMTRYRGSVLGIVWSLVQPLMMLAVYTFVFRVIFTGRWQEQDGDVEFALVLFSGLIVYNLFAESLGAAPGLLTNYKMYVTKVVFPLEILPWVVLANGLFHAFVSYTVLLVGLLWIQGGLHWTALLGPFVLVPLVFLTLGFVWLLSSLGVYFRDFGQLVNVILVLLMFMSPIFYPLSAVPDGLRWFLAINPLTPILEQMRALVIYGHLPDLAAIGLSYLWGCIVAWMGFAFFQWTKKGFADVI